MARTTIDIDGPILAEVKALQRKEGRSLGKIVSELLADALAHRRAPADEPKLVWHTTPGGTLVDISDKEALYAILDRDES